MAKIGDLFMKDGVAYKVTAVPTEEGGTYSVIAMHTKSTPLVKTITSSQSTTDLIPSGAIITGIEEDALGSPVGHNSAIAQTVADGKVKVFFKGNGGSETDAQVIDKGGKVTVPSNPTRTGYTFAGWFQDAEGTGSAFNLATKTFAVDTYCYAKWTINTYTVTYDSNSGSPVEPQTVAYGETATKPNDPALLGHLFAGWYTDDDTFEAPFDFETPIVDNITLYAKWNEAVTVTFDSNGGSDVEAQVIAKGEKATKPDDPELENNVFAGWFYDDVDFTDEVDFLVDIFEADDTLYAKWTP
ncbi:MAG: InlB B-repeat-containing protein, partial [Prevotella sp.]